MKSVKRLEDYRPTTRLVVFDLDGTLIDTMGSFADIAGDLLRQYYGWNFEQARKRYLETSGIPFFQQMEILAPNGNENQVIVDLFEKRKIGAFVREVLPETTILTLHELRDLKILTAISSNNFDSLVAEYVKRENVPVDAALGFRPDFAKGAAHFTFLHKFFGVSFQEMMFVGDSLSDAIRAEESGIRFVAKLGTFTELDFRAEQEARPTDFVYEIHEILNVLEVS
jgi:phosphoglycolate phosphatase-like HAD superfamily hydrolase